MHEKTEYMECVNPQIQHMRLTWANPWHDQQGDIMVLCSASHCAATSGSLKTRSPIALLQAPHSAPQIICTEASWNL